MTVQIDQIFTATTENILTFLSTAGQGCYVPAYQRPYAWDSRNVDRLFEDAISGLNHLMIRPAAISFLGTLIAIHDTSYATVQPIFRPEVAPRVMTIIDGQQRITTSVMINIALHAHLTGTLAKLGAVAGDEFDWIREQCALALADLWSTFAMDRTTGVPAVYQWYPRVIRAIEDVWSKKGVQASYASPIAALTWAYISYVKAPPAQDKGFTHSVSKDGKPDERHQATIDVYKHVVWQLGRLTGRYWENYDFPDIQQIVNDAKFVSALWSFPASSEVVKFINEGSASRSYIPFTTLFRTLIFYKYFCTRMALTVVTTRTEDDAFDMFEALNTTGEPLTAFETFRPKVIESEGLLNWDGSVTQQAMERVERYLDAFRKADERQRATAEMLIPFALAETGEKLSKNLSDQRRYLRDVYQGQDQDARRSLVCSLSSLAAFMQTGWNADIDKTPHLEGVAEFDEETGFCFQALRHLKHNVAVAGLSRFYDEVRRAPDEERGVRAGEFVAAIKATTAFSMLWRGAKGGTENIDQIYRSIMRDGDPKQQIPQLAKRSGPKRGTLSLANYRRLLRQHLAQAFPDKAAWVAEASRTPIYDHSAPVAKFLIIAASHDTVVDAKEEGLIERGRHGVAPTIQSAIWRADATFSVEHVAPQSRPATGWEDEIYEPGTRHVGRLGNLTVLPSGANSFVGNKNWPQKRALYRYFASETAEAAAKVAATFPSVGLSVSDHGTALLETSAYLPMLKAVSTYEFDWDVDIIERRSVRLAELAYDTVIGWLSDGEG